MSSDAKIPCPACGASITPDAAQCDWCLTKIEPQNAATRSQWVDDAAGAEPVARRSKPSWEQTTGPQSQAMPQQPAGAFQTQAAQPQWQTTPQHPFNPRAVSQKNGAFRPLVIITFILDIFFSLWL